MKLQRILIGFGAPALAWLRGEAARIGISVNELVRRCVDKEREPSEVVVRKWLKEDGKDGKR